MYVHGLETPIHIIDLSVNKIHMLNAWSIKRFVFVIQIDIVLVTSKCFIMLEFFILDKFFF